MECRAAGGINLAQGVCDTPVPDVIIKAAHEAMLAGVNSYTSYDGLPELRQAIAHKYRALNKIDVDPDRNVVASCGATGAFLSACLALLNPGDEVVMFEPYYQYHESTLRAVGVRPVFVPMRRPGWRIDMDEVRRAITPRTRAMVINTPGNPTGRVLTRKELEDLGGICEQAGLFLISDEIYEMFVYDGREHVSAWSIPSLRERSIIVSGYSKTFSITGWRVGYCVSDERWSETIAHMSDLVYVCPPAPLQVGVARGIMELPPSFYEEMARAYQRRRDLLVSALNDAGMPAEPPQGAYYVLADVSSVPGRNGRERAMSILRDTGVASVPGTAFCSRGGNGLVRICFAKSEDVLERACAALRGRR